MIASKFVIDILTLLIDSSEHEEKLLKQLPLLKDFDYEYTGAGVFVTFDLDSEISQYKISSDMVVLNGVKVESSQIHFGAEAAVFVINGIINFLEIWSYDAKYPTQELDDYVITQIWTGSPGKQLTL